MSIKNKRTPIAKTNPVEERLKKQLKEDFDMSLHEEEDDLPEEGMGDDSMMSDGGGSELGGELGGDDMGSEMGGDDDLGMDDGMSSDPDSEELTPTQEEWIDDEVDQLITGDYGNHEGAGDELGMGEEGNEFSLDEDEDADFANTNSELDSLDSEVEGGGEQLVGHGDDVFSADELNSIVDSPDTLYDLEDSLVQKSEEIPTDEMDSDIDSFDDSEMGSEEDFFGESEETDGDKIEEDAKSNYPTAGKPMTGLKGEDHGDYDQGYEGKERKDELMEGELPEGFEETTSDLQGKYTKAPSGAAKAKKIETKPTFSKVSDTQKKAVAEAKMVKESRIKSRMLVKAATAILKLKEANKQLQFENAKLSRVNGIFAAVGEKLTKDTRKKIAEKFEGCKDAKSFKTLYEKVVKVIKSQNKPSLNEAVSKADKTTVKQAPKQEGKQVIKESLTAGQKRINHLMGYGDNSEGYFRHESM